MWPVDARWRIARASTYVGESYQAVARAGLSNSSSTSRPGCQPPAITSCPPPLTKKRPSNAAIEPGVSAR